jgi:superoxide dismutase, Fe-Mn family
MAFTTPDLPYDYKALEPHIDEATMRVHHDKHHTGYTSKLNAAVEGTEFADTPIEQLIAGLAKLPEKIRTAVQNNGGGHYNHALFWPMLSPAGGGEPDGKPASLIKDAFGDYASFKEQFAAAATGRFGSGWAWLVRSPNGKLAITSTANQDSPLTDGHVPLLGLDVWEHAYYLKYQNRRAEYVQAFYNIINWEQVARNLSAAK